MTGRVVVATGRLEAARCHNHAGNCTLAVPSVPRPRRGVAGLNVYPAGSLGGELSDFIEIASPQAHDRQPANWGLADQRGAGAVSPRGFIPNA